MTWIKVLIDNGTFAYIQAAELKGSEFVDSELPAANPVNRRPYERRLEEVEEALDVTMPLLKRLSTALKNINNPKEIEIEFGIGVKIENGALVNVFCQAGVEGTLTVKIRWENDSKKS